MYLTCQSPKQSKVFSTFTVEELCRTKGWLGHQKSGKHVAKIYLCCTTVCRLIAQEVQWPLLSLCKKIGPLRIIFRRFFLSLTSTGSQLTSSICSTMEMLLLLTNSEFINSGQNSIVLLMKIFILRLTQDQLPELTFNLTPVKSPVDENSHTTIKRTSPFTASVIRDDQPQSSCSR